MSLLNELAEAWWAWMAPMFWQVSLLIIIVAVIDRLTARKVWPQVAYALWLLVLVKLVLPPGLSSPASLTAYVFRERAFEVESIAMRGTVEVDAAPLISPVESRESSGEVASVSAIQGPAMVPRPKVRVSLSWRGHLMVG